MRKSIILSIIGIVFIFVGALLKVLKIEHASIILSTGLIIEILALCTVFYEINHKNKSS